VRITIPKSKVLCHTPYDVWSVSDSKRIIRLRSEVWQIKVWHIATVKNNHIVRFAVGDRQFEIYFYKSGRVARLYPVKGKTK
jgi:hypothetical protein